MKHMEITGNVGKDAEICIDSNKKEFATFMVAVRSGKKQEWIYVTCYNRELEFAMQHAKKGNKIYVRGEPSIQTHTNQVGEIKANFRMYAYFMELQSVKPPKDNNIEIIYENDYE